MSTRADKQLRHPAGRHYTSDDDADSTAFVQEGNVPQRRSQQICLRHATSLHAIIPHSVHCTLQRSVPCPPPPPTKTDNYQLIVIKFSTRIACVHRTFPLWKDYSPMDNDSIYCYNDSVPNCTPPEDKLTYNPCCHHGFDKPPTENVKSRLVITFFH